MTDGEIIKALYFMRCAADYKDTITINKKTAIGLYDLINRLQAENENYSKNNQTMTSDILKLYKELEQAKAENERLKPLEKFSEFNSHIRVEDMFVCANSLDEWLEFCDNLKAEAYKEFAERLKSFLLLNRPSEMSVLSFDDIERLLKEMVGEDK